MATISPRARDEEGRYTNDVVAPFEERFWAKVEASHPLSCWWWTGKISPQGYGKFTLGQRSLGERRDVYAHRMAYELLIALIPPGMQIDHLCRNKLCVNPDHLQIVTQAENMRRRYAVQTHCKHGHAFTQANTYITPSTGRRACRLCHLIWKGRVPAADVRAVRVELGITDGSG